MFIFFQNSSEVVLGAPGVFYWQGKLILLKKFNFAEKRETSDRQFRILIYLTNSIQVQ
jgi:hypothetical protein